MSKIPVQDVTPKVETYDLYAKRQKIQTRSYKGLFMNVRLAGVAALFLLYFGTVWLPWGDRQAVLWDLPARQFHIFGATFQPQDFFLLSFLLIICAFGLSGPGFSCGQSASPRVSAMHASSSTRRP